MRRAFFTVAVVGVAALAAVVGLAIPAGAKITVPASGATVSGTTTITDDGTNSGGATTLLGSSCTGSTQMFVDMGAGTANGALVATGTADSGTGTVVSLAKTSSTGSTNPQTGTWVTDNWGNGTYSVNSTEVSDASDVLFCASSKTTNAHETVTVSNTGELTYGGATSGSQGSSVTVKATLTDQNSIAAGNGQTVSFALSGGTTVTGTTTGGVATATLPVSNGPRNATLTVSYGGTYFTAVTITQPFTVTQDATTTTLSPTTSTDYGQTANFTATVVSQVPGEPTPSGTVQFTEDGLNAGLPQADQQEAASPPSPTPASLPTHTPSAPVYSGDTNFLASSATSLNQVVALAPTSTGVVSSVTPTSFGQAVSFTATVTATSPGPDTGAPSGSVSFVATPTGGGSSINVGGAVALNASGTNVSTATSSSISLLQAGAYTVAAVYNPTANYAASNSSLPQTVNPAQTSVGLTSTLPTSSDYGQAVQFTAVVTTAPPGCRLADRIGDLRGGQGNQCANHHGHRAGQRRRCERVLGHQPSHFQPHPRYPPDHGHLQQHGRELRRWDL